jgi:hypothetical protein
MRLISLLIAAFLAASALPVPARSAADGTPAQIRGTVQSLDGRTLVVTARDGQVVTVLLAADVKVSTVAKVDLAAVKAGDFIGTAAVRGTDGRLHAQEVLVFPEAMRGVGEGHRAWDLTPDSTMTNATVAEVAEAAKGRRLRLDYKGGSQELEVAPDAPVVTLAPGDIVLVKPGTVVFVMAMKKADGTLEADRLVAGKNGVDPPM